MKKQDQYAFFAREDELDSEQYVVLDYYLEVLSDPHETAARLCQEMSTAQWQRVGVDEDFRPRFAAKVVNIDNIRELDQPGSPYLARLSGWKGEKLRSCSVRMYYPYGNFGVKIPNLLTVICGEGAFHAPNICAIRLQDISFPESFLKEFQGPQFGVRGLRDMLDVHDRPLFFGVIKPNVGLPPQPFGELAYQAWLGGLDVAKDDEQLGDVDWSTLDERTRIVGQFRRRAEIETGRKKIYMANITDEVERLIESHDIAVANGANALLINSMTTGLSAVRMLRKHARVPLVSHNFELLTLMTQIPYHGVREVVFTKLLRMVGFDAMIYPGFGARMKSAPEDIMASARACLSPMGTLKPILPIPAGSQWAGSLGELKDALGTIDFGIVPGRGVFGHPQGPKGGAASLHQGWEAVSQGVPLEEYAQNHEELRLAILSRQKG